MSALTQHTIQAPGFNDFSGNYYEGRTVDSIDSSLGAEGQTFAQSILFDSPWATFFSLSLLFSLVLGVGIVYAILRIKQIRKMEGEYYALQPLSSIAGRVFDMRGTSSAGTAHSVRWREVVVHVNSQNSNDWRQAILEADVMLDDAITKRGYTGEGIGEKMKQVLKSDINTIDDAWEAHKVRNRIAHEGSSLELTQREARRVIGLYERVLTELGHIEA